MTTRTGYLPILSLLLLLAVPAAFAQDDAAPAATQPAFSQAELDRMLAPIALYPDALLSQILIAATYPLEVVQAARWSRANPGLSGGRAVEAVATQSWDPSVKALVAFPRVLGQMDEKLEWTQELGDAFLAQPEQVMDTVQNLRRRAYAAGNLATDARYRVEERDGNIVIEPVEPHVVYVPYYDPRVIYGPWWWAGYPPVYWAPWPGYHVHVGSGFHWSIGVFVGPHFFLSVWDWPHRHIKVVHVHRHVPHAHTHKWAHQVWRHDPRHRHGVKYRHVHVHKAFAHPHRHDARRDWLRHARRAAEGAGSGGFRHDRPAARVHKGRDLAPAGIGRLGMRHDRHVTSRPPTNLPLRGNVTPRAGGHDRLPHAAPLRQPHGSGSHGFDRAVRSNAAAARALERARVQASRAPATRAHSGFARQSSPGMSGRAGRVFRGQASGGGGRGFGGFR